MTRLALGCAPLGNLFQPVDDAQASATVDAAWELGVREFDTAPHYGAGLSERRLGAALAGRPRAELAVSTKVGRLLVPSSGPVRGGGADMFADAPALDRVFDFSRDGILRSLESSLQRLTLDRVDIVYVHDPDDYLDEAIDQALPTLADLRAEGVIRDIGVGMNQAPALVRIAREADVDRILVAGRYTLLDQSAAEELLPLCARRGVAVVVGGVLNSGILADPRPGAMYDYAPAPPELVEQARRIASICARYDTSLVEAAIAFPLRHPAVRTVLVGARSPQEVSAAAAAVARSVPEGLWQELEDAGLLTTWPTPAPRGRAW
jgi:D-threo-aldose 1-dehydrogenase